VFFKDQLDWWLNNKLSKKKTMVIITSLSLPYSVPVLYYQIVHDIHSTVYCNVIRETVYPVDIELIDYRYV
jgi:hypothetical protein